MQPVHRTKSNQTLEGARTGKCNNEHALYVYLYTITSIVQVHDQIFLQICRAVAFFRLYRLSQFISQKLNIEVVKIPGTNRCTAYKPDKEAVKMRLSCGSTRLDRRFLYDLSMLVLRGNKHLTQPYVSLPVKRNYVLILRDILSASLVMAQTSAGGEKTKPRLFTL